MIDKESLNKLSEKVIGAAIEVHRDLGPGLLESSYEAALQHELALQGAESARQLSLPIHYKGLELPDAYRSDLLVEDAVVVESKRSRRSSRRTRPSCSLTSACLKSTSACRSVFTPSG
jgi:GxxExxY protein